VGADCEQAIKVSSNLREMRLSLKTRIDFLESSEITCSLTSMPLPSSVTEPYLFFKCGVGSTISNLSPSRMRKVLTPFNEFVSVSRASGFHKNILPDYVRVTGPR